jgi:serine/threonine protein kinase/tetratricopeptide (TPR) repeat protein
LPCDVSRERLWSWIDRSAPELEAHLAQCPQCRALADQYRTGISAVAAGCMSDAVPLPAKIGSYVITGLLGEGGQALVYKAEQQTPRRPVALKVLKGGRCVGEHDVRHFQREIQTLAALSHPAIATIHEGGRTAEGQHFFAMELIDGVPLDTYVRERNLSLRERLEVFCKVCEGVQYAHERGVIHRDLKPANILVVEQGAEARRHEGTKGSIGVSPVFGVGQPKILDFGLARLLNTDVTLTQTATQTGQIMGTLRYMSPAQARGNPDEIDERSDIYSLGVILYEVLTDRPPYELSNVIPDAVRTICETLPRRPSSISRALRGDLETVVLKALEKEPSRRYASVGALADDLRRHLTGEPIRARPPSRLYVLRRKLAKHRLILGLAAAALALGLVGTAGGIWWTQRAGERQRAQELALSEERHTRETEHARLSALTVQFDVEDGRAKYKLGQAEALLGEYPSLPEATLAFAQARVAVYRETGDAGMRDRAIVSLRTQPGAKPSHWACRALLAELVGDDELRAQADRQAPDTADAWYLRTFTTLSPEDAWRYAETAVKRGPSRQLAPLVWQRFAHLSLETKRFEDAVFAARKLVVLEDDQLTWLLFEGFVLMRQGRYADASGLFDQVTALFPSDNRAYRFRAACQLCLKDYENAWEGYSKAVGMVGADRSFAVYLRATPLWIMGRTEEAAADYRTSRRSRVYAEYANLRLFLVLRDRAGQLEQEGQIGTARECRREADSLLASEPRGSASEGWSGKIRECLAGRLSPEELVRDAGGSLEPLCEAYYYAGERCRLAGDMDQARGWFAKCRDTGLALDPDTFPPDPMNEYHLALWRLDQLAGDPGAASQPAR